MEYVPKHLHLYLNKICFCFICLCLFLQETYQVWKFCPIRLIKKWKLIKNIEYFAPFDQNHWIFCPILIKNHWIFCSYWSKSLNILLLLIKIIIFIIPPTNVLRAPQWSWPSPIDDIMRGSSPMYRSTVGNTEIQKRNIWKKSLIF